MTLFHVRSDRRDDYHHYSTDRLVTVQIGKSTNPGKYVWMVFHPDIRCAITGGETESLDAARREADSWVTQWVQPAKA
jgi:hypothetical protein